MKRIAMLGVLMVAVAACGSVAEEVAERAIERAAEADGADIDVDFDIDSDSGEMSVTGVGEDGDVDVNIGGGDVPDGFSMPIPDGGDVVTSMSQASGDELSATVVVQYPDDRYESLVEFYDDYVSDLGDGVQRTEQSGEFSSVTWFDQESQQLITVTSTGDGQTVVNLAVGFG